LNRLLDEQNSFNYIYGDFNDQENEINKIGD
jgi:hypothetical protein